MYRSDQDGDNEIFTMNADGTGPTQLTFNSDSDGGPSWSPDGTKIAFTSSRDDPWREIYTMRADGSDVTNLTNSPGTSEVEPDWSPDGTKVAFETDRDGNDEIYLMNSDGSAQTNLTNNPGSDETPDWSPDGAKIAFHTTRDGNMEIYSMEADGSGQTNLSQSATSVDGVATWQPVTVPDEETITQSSYPDSCVKVIYENRLAVRREIKLEDLINKNGVEVRVAADKPSTGKLKIEITGERARQYRIYKNISSKKNKVVAKADVTIGTGYKKVQLKARGKTIRAIKRVLRLKKAPKSAKLKVSLTSYAVSNKRLKRQNTQTIRALWRGKPHTRRTYEKVRQVVDKTRCEEPLTAKISGPRDAKISALVTREAKRGKGLKVKVSCSENCIATVGFRVWGRYEVGLKIRKPGQKNVLLSNSRVKLNAGETKTLKLDGVNSKKLRTLLVRGARKQRYKRIKFKYFVDAKSADGKSASATGTSRVLLRF